MKQYIAALATALSCWCGAGAVEITCTPGSLNTLVTTPETVTSLTLTGSVDAADLFFVGSKMTALKTLDLSKVSIVAYKGERLEGFTAYDAATIPQGAFSGTKISTLTLPDTPVAIGDFAFASTDISTLTVPATVTSIGQSAFAACAKLTEVSLADATMGGYVFKNCTALTTVDLGNTTAIAQGDFADCSALTTALSNGKVRTIGDEAFEGCTKLAGFDFPTSLTSVGASAFAHTALVTADLEGCAGLRAVGDWAFKGCADLTDVILPAGVNTVGQGAFFECKALRSFTYPPQVSNVADYVFKDAVALSEVYLPEAATSIGKYSFKGADKLETLLLPEGTASIGDGAMEGDTGLKSIDASALTEVPALGTDVWDGVDQSKVQLFVHDDDMADAFGNADQWQNFVIDIFTGAAVTEVVTETTIRGAISGSTLLLEAVGADIARVQLYDIAGRLLADVATADARVALDISHIGTGALLVRCILADGTVGTLKLSYKA